MGHRFALQLDVGAGWVFFNFYRVLPSIDRVLLGYTGFYRVSQSSIQFEWLLQGFLCFQRVFLGFTGFYRVSIGFN